MGISPNAGLANLSNKVLSSPVSTNLSAFVSIVGGSCFGSPNATIRLQSNLRGRRETGSVICEASSKKTMGNSIPCIHFKVVEWQVVATIRESRMYLDGSLFDTLDNISFRTMASSSVLAISATSLVEFTLSSLLADTL
eukprot:NODE_638_length_5124_cov_1.416119.p5 type:complete len:139 gc:universal NODE_638_length_5124_cov_1.416119:1850-1434(-)